MGLIHKSSALYQSVWCGSGVLVEFVLPEPLVRMTLVKQEKRAKNEEKWQEGMCKVSRRMRNKARVEEWKMWQQDIGDKTSRTLKTFREEVCMKSCIGGTHNPFLHAVTVNKNEGSSIVANATLIRVQKPPEHKLTIAGVTLNEWTQSACTALHTVLR